MLQVNSYNFYLAYFLSSHLFSILHEASQFILERSEESHQIKLFHLTNLFKKRKNRRHYTLIDPHMLLSFWRTFQCLSLRKAFLLCFLHLFHVGTSFPANALIKIMKVSPNLCRFSVSYICEFSESIVKYY